MWNNKNNSILDGLKAKRTAPNPIKENGVNTVMPGLIDERELGAITLFNEAKKRKFDEDKVKRDSGGRFKSFADLDPVRKERINKLTDKIDKLRENNPNEARERRRLERIIGNFFKDDFKSVIGVKTKNGKKIGRIVPHAMYQAKLHDIEADDIINTVTKPDSSEISDGRTLYEKTVGNKLIHVIADEKGVSDVVVTVIDKNKIGSKESSEGVLKMLNAEQLEFVAKEANITNESVSAVLLNNKKAITLLCMNIVCDESALEEVDDEKFNPCRFYMAESILRDM